MKDSIHLDTLLSFNKFATVLAVFKRFPLLTPFQYLFAPMGKVRLFAQMERVTRDSVLKRIDQRGSTEHDDYFEYILPADSPKPSDPRELLHIGSVALQVMFAGWGPMGDLFYGALALLLQEPNCYKALAEEVRTHFQDYESITPTELGSLPYLHACVEETLRMLPSNNTGLPRISPGATVDGHYVPKGVRASISYYLCSVLSREVRRLEAHITVLLTISYRHTSKAAFGHSLAVPHISTILFTFGLKDGFRLAITFTTRRLPQTI